MNITIYQRVKHVDNMYTTYQTQFCMRCTYSAMVSRIKGATMARGVIRARRIYETVAPSVLFIFYHKWHIWKKNNFVVFLASFLVFINYKTAKFDNSCLRFLCFVGLRLKIRLTDNKYYFLHRFCDFEDFCKKWEGYVSILLPATFSMVMASGCSIICMSNFIHHAAKKFIKVRVVSILPLCFVNNRIR